MDRFGDSQEFSMPLLEGDDFFKNLDALEQDFVLEDEIQDYEGELDLGSDQEDDEETYIESPDYPDTPVERLSRQEQLRMMHLRSHLNQLTEKVKHHQYMTEKTRDELKQCRSKISELEKERNEVRTEIHAGSSEGNQSAIHRLRAQHDRISQEISDEQAIEKLICERLEKEELRAQHDRISQEISDEQAIEKLICERLEKEEYELAKVDVERGKFLLAEDELVKKEDQLAKEKTDNAIRRLRKEERKANQAEHNLRNKDRQYQEMMREQALQQRIKMDNAKYSHEKHSKFVNDTVQKMKQRQEEENVRYKENMTRKMDMLLKLKGDITANRENLKALRARDKAAEKMEEKKVKEVRQKILEEGGNPDEILLIQKRMEQVERQKSQFELQQREKKANIMEKVLIEEERMRRRKKQQPLLWEDPKREKSKLVGPQKKKPLTTFEEFKKMSTDDDLQLDLTDSLDEQILEKLDADTEKMTATREGTALDLVDTDRPVIADSSDNESDEDAGPQVVDLAKPEFEGLWSQHKPYKVPKDMESSPLKLPGASKMDKVILNEVLEKHRAGIVVKQVAAGREFTGCPFYSKPDVIHFKDFVVGKTYKKKVTLTNVSYTVNYCKYLDITERLKDFIHIHFDPPGQMSAGLTCEMLVTFQPMINEDLEGEVKFLSQTGPFQIPLRCTTKKCDLSVDTDVIQFGTTVIDETLKRTFTLTNRGALGTTFEFFKVTGMKAKTATSAQTSLGRMTPGEMTQPVTPETTNLDKSKKDTTSADTMGKKTEAEQSKTTLGPGDGVGTIAEETEISSQAGQDGDEKRDDQDGEDQHAYLDLAPGTPETLLQSIYVTSIIYTTPAPTKPALDQIPDDGGSPDLALSEMDDYGSLDGMRVGPIATGEIGPFASTKLEIIWNPSVPGKVDSEFLVRFADPESESISIRALGNAIDVPVWVERQTVDLKICMFDRLYQDTIVVNNRATTALRLKFEVCKELRNHLELLPKTGYIQAQSQFSAQLKFLPRQSLLEEGGKYFDRETGVLEAPMIITVADQTAPVPFTVTGVVTNSDMEFDVQDIDFGCCTIYESNKTTIKLTNKSILPQEFGFVGHPEYVEVQPNDGFGTLLPLETVELDVIFSPSKARDYKFELNCKSVINREFKIQCKGVGVHPPLDLSKQVIHFSATSLYDVSVAACHVINAHTSMNEFTHPVPRIGKGEIAPVGPTSFEFVLPEDAPLTISPSVGTIQPGEKCRVQVRFAPTLREEDIQKEAVRMATRMMEQRADREYKEALKKQKEAEEAQKAAPAGKKGAPSSSKAGAPKGKQTPANTTGLTVTGPTPVVPPKEEDITKDSAEYAAGLGSLLRQFKGKFNSFTIPCYVASGECTNPGELPYSIHNTLYLEVHCPTVKPPLVVISDNGKTTTDFGDVSLGQNSFKSITIQNISNRTLELSSSALDTTGPFQVMNALRVLPPDATHTMLVSFTPTAGRVFQEELSVNTLTASLHIMLMGKGVSPLVSLSPAIADSGILDVGAVLAGEYLEKSFKMQNTSSLSIDYSIRLESLSLLRHGHAQKLPEFIDKLFMLQMQNTSSLSIDYSIRLESLSLLRHGHAQKLPEFIDKSSKPLVGVQNNNGQNVFDLVPADGTIAPGGSVEITITFAPDHASDCYADGVKIELFGKEESHAFQLRGSAKSKIMFIEGGEQLRPGIESLAIKPTIPVEDEEVKHLPPVLVSLKSVAKDDVYQPASKEVHIGCVRTMAVSQKKNGEFSIENVQQITPKGFNIDPQKGMVEAGVLKPITVTWTPPQGYDPNQPMEASVLVTLKGDAVEQYKLLLRAMVISE